MEDKEFPPIYSHSFAEAKQLGELNDWKASHKANIACREAIEEAIRRDFDGMHLKNGCAESVINQFGYHRMSYVLANSLQCKDYDGRFSRGNRDWAKQAYIPPDKDSYSNRNLDFAVDSHPAVLDGFVSQYRRAYQALGLFDHMHCLPDTEKQDFEGKVLVLSTGILKESCLTVQDQLWLCTGGFGAHAGASGRAVFAVNLADGEKTRWTRTDFAGVLAETMERLDGWLIQDNCKSRSEFIEKALCFYMGYLGTEDTSSYLSKALLSSMEGTLQKTENRVASNLFRLSVEISMMMHLLAATLEITDEELYRLRSRCVAEVKRTRGKIRLDDAVEFQNSAEGSE